MTSPTHPLRHLTPADHQWLSILVVDDDSMVREATAGVLADAGHHVTEAADGIAALEYLQQLEPIDLVISDIGMPRMDGLALVDALALRWPDLPVLLVSGRRQPPGTPSFIVKPFRSTVLLEAVDRVVDAMTEAGTAFDSDANRAT